MTATTARTNAVPTAVSRLARPAVLGAALWTLSSVVWGISDLEVQEFGSLSFVAVAIAWWVSMVLAPALVVLGHAALRTALGPAAGRAAVTGIALAAVGVGAMALGIGIEIASMTIGGGEVPLGHAILLIGFLVAVVGGLMTGVTVLRRRRDGMSRTAGWLLVLALPLGAAIMFVGDAVAPETDALFWAGLTVPMGLAWTLLARSLARDVPAVA